MNTRRMIPWVGAILPLGAMDAKEEQGWITCDVTGIRSYTVGNIKLTPGVAGAEAGNFRWDLALVHLHPYQVIARSIWYRIDIPGRDPGGGGGGGFID